MHRSSSAASRRACGASRTTTIGRRKCGARSCSTRAPICSCSATASGRSSRSRTAWRPASNRARMRDIRGTALLGSAADDGWTEIDSTHLDTPGPVDRHPDPYAMEPEIAAAAKRDARAGRARRALHAPRADGRSRAQLHPFAELRASRATTRCSTRTRRGSCTWSRTPATRARSCSATASATSG